jgi:SSS family solute:Na+ symporter/sodium/proline symporter
VLAVFFWRRSTAAGAVSSIILGTIVTIAWELFQQYGPPGVKAAIGGIDAIYPALLMSVVSLVVVTLRTRPTITKDDDRSHTRSSARQQT